MQKVTIIAEAGVNHNGSLENALRLIDVAADAGADYVKFQTFKADNLVCPSARKADYQQRNGGGTDETQWQMLKGLELAYDQHEVLVAHCRKRQIGFLSTAFDTESLAFLHTLGMDLVKIPSGEITNLPLLRMAAQRFRRVVLSTGMASMQEIAEALAPFTQAGIPLQAITILHCNTAYPTPMEEVNLRAMRHIGEHFGTPVGYSDHTLGIEVPIAAVALGATVIEKHFTLSKEMQGPDHKASLEPHELGAMVTAIRNIEKALGGSGEKVPTRSEMENRAVARKSIVAKRVIKKGERFSESNLAVKRPGNGLSPMRWDEVVGRIAARDFLENEPITL